ncbi:MAG: hypothetical protein P1V81_07075 [Planctomycetota bacterium]|nr:hypothetical protein [Planctomycetota bacterium]
MDTPYQLLWLSCEAEPALADRFFLPEFRGQLPFLIEGPAPAAGTAAGSLREEDLLKGILTGLAEHDHAGRLTLRATDQATLLEALEILRQGYSFEDLEQLVIEVSGDLRSRYGVRPSCAALSTGVLLAPTSGKLKADLILDQWAIAQLASDDPSAFLLRILELFADLDPGHVPAPTMEICTYFALAARHALGDFSEEGSLEEFLVARVVEVVLHPQLKTKVQAIITAEQAGQRLDLGTLHVE